MTLLALIQKPWLCCVAIVVVLGLVKEGRAACYLPNGDSAADYDAVYNAYQPCNRSANVSMCCRTNLPDEADRDHCRSDGLCEDAKSNLWRNMCTDNSWNSPSCIKLCVNSSGMSSVEVGASGVVLTASLGLDPFGHVMGGESHGIALTTCDDGSFCCGVNATSCCGSGNGVWINSRGEETRVNPNGTSSSSSLSSASGSSSTSSSATTTASSTLASASQGRATSSSPTSSSSLSATTLPQKFNNTGAIVGGVVGGVAGVALLAGALFWLLRRRRTNSQNLPLPYVDKPGPELAQSESNAVIRSELPAVDRPYEADGEQLSEMDGGARRYWK